MRDGFYVLYRTCVYGKRERKENHREREKGKGKIPSAGAAFFSYLTLPMPRTDQTRTERILFFSISEPSQTHRIPRVRTRVNNKYHNPTHLHLRFHLTPIPIPISHIHIKLELSSIHLTYQLHTFPNARLGPAPILRTMVWVWWGG